MASSRKYPAAYAVHSYGNATRAYTALANWEADTDVNLAAVTTLDQDSSGTTLYVADTALFEACELGVSTVRADGQVLTVLGVASGVSLAVSPISGVIASGTAVQCGFFLWVYGDASPYNDKADLGGASTTPELFRGLAPAPGHGHDGTAATGVKVAYGASELGNTEGVVKIQEAFSRVHDLVLSMTQNNANNPYTVFMSAANTVAAGCLIDRPLNSGAGTANGIRVYAAASCVAVNCLVDTADYGVVFGPLGSGFAYNCTVVNCAGAGFYDAGATCVAKNCIAEGNAANWYGTWSRTTCTDDGGVVFVDAAGHDFHLDTTDTVAKGQGTDLSADPVFPFEDDVDSGAMAAPWPVGMDFPTGLLLAASVFEGIAAREIRPFPAEIGPAALGDDGYRWSEGLDRANQLTFAGAYGSMPFARCPGCPIPPGAPVFLARFQLVAYGNYLGAGSVKIHCNAADDAVAPVNHNEFDALALTPGVSWSWSDAWATDGVYFSEDFATEVQAVVDRPGYAQGNAIMPVCSTPSGSERGAHSLDTGGGAKKPILLLGWTGPSPTVLATLRPGLAEGAGFSDDPAGRAHCFTVVGEGIGAGDQPGSIARLRAVVAEILETAEAAAAAMTTRQAVDDGFSAADFVAVLRVVHASLADGLWTNGCCWFSADGLIRVDFSARQATITCTAMAATITMTGKTFTIAMSGRAGEREAE